MHYKTIALELIEAEPALHERLKASRTMLTTMERYALALKSGHEHWMEQLRQARPQSDPAQLSSEALELAVMEIQASIAAESQPSGSTEPPAAQ